jgi:hypothetical protein
MLATLNKNSFRLRHRYKILKRNCKRKIISIKLPFKRKMKVKQENNKPRKSLPTLKQSLIKKLALKSPKPRKRSNRLRSIMLNSKRKLIIMKKTSKIMKKGLKDFKVRIHQEQSDKIEIKDTNRATTRNSHLLNFKNSRAN